MNTTADAKWILAESEMKQGNFDRALQLFESLLEQDNNNFQIWYCMGICKLFNLVSNPIQLYPKNKSTIEVAFRYFSKSIECLGHEVFINPDNGEPFDISSYDVERIDIKSAGSGIISFVFQAIEKLRSLFDSESMAANRNFESAKIYACQAGGARFMGITNPNNNTYNNAFQANFAMQSENTAQTLYQEYQNNLHRLNLINDIIQNLKDASRHFTSILKCFFSQDELDKFNWQLLSPHEKEEYRKLERSNAFLAESEFIIDFSKQHHNYQIIKKEAESFFENKKYKLAINAAQRAIECYKEVLEEARELKGSLRFEHKETGMMDIIATCTERRKGRNTALILVICAIAVIIFFFYFKS